MRPLFESSDTGARVFLVEGKPPKVNFHVNDKEIIIDLRDMLEIYKVFNGVWYSGQWHTLGICVSGLCSYKPPCHIRTELCPPMTPYEKTLYEESLRRLRSVHMEANRPPIADGVSSHNT